MKESIGVAATPPGSRPTDRAADGVSPVPASIPNAVDEMQRLVKLCECGSEAGQKIILTDVAGFLSAEARVYELLHAGAFIDAAVAMLPPPAIWRRYTDLSCSVYAASPYNAQAQTCYDGISRFAPLAICAGLLRMKLAPLLKAQAIEARRAETTKIGSVEDESAVLKGCAHE